MICHHCGTTLAAGRCPGDQPLHWHDGHYYGTAAQMAHTLGVDITANRLHDWARRSRKPGDKLHGKLPRHHLPGRGRGTTWFRRDQAVTVEAITSKRLENKGGPGRRGRVELTAAA